MALRLSCSPAAGRPAIARGSFPAGWLVPWVQSALPPCLKLDKLDFVIVCGLWAPPARALGATEAGLNRLLQALYSSASGFMEEGRVALTRWALTLGSAAWQLPSHTPTPEGEAPSCVSADGSS